MSAELKKMISNKRARIAVLGLGYVGLPLAVNFAKAGFKVFGLDKAADRVKRIQEKKSHLCPHRFSYPINPQKHRKTHPEKKTNTIWQVIPSER